MKLVWPALALLASVVAVAGEPTPQKTTEAKGKLVDVAAPPSESTAQDDAGGTSTPATDKLAPDLHLDSPPPPTSWAAPARMKLFTDLVRAKSEAGASNAYAPLPGIAKPLSSSAAAPGGNLAPISIENPAARKQVSSGNAAAKAAPLVLNSAAREAIQFFSAQSDDPTTKASLAVERQVLSPGGRGKVGTSRFSKGLSFDAGGIYYFDFVTSGRDAKTDSVWASSLQFGAHTDNPFTIALGTYAANGSPGVLPTTAFNANVAGSWLLASSERLLGFNAAVFVVDSSGFLNDLKGGTFSVSASGNNLLLNFTPVPEPSTWALLIVGGSVAAIGEWRRRRGSRA